MAFLDGQSRIVRHNPAFATALDRSSRDLDGRPLSDAAPAFHGDVRYEIADALRGTRRATAAPVEICLERGESVKHLAASFYRVGLRGERDASSGVGVVVTDVTRQRVWEQEIEAARDVADAANRAKSAFIANMSHELRTPLSAVIGYCELLEDEMIEQGHDGLLRDLGKINANARHLLGLINDVLDLSKIEAQKMDVLATEFDIDAMLGDIESAVGSLVGKKRNILRVVSKAPGAMVSDELKIRQILLNLVGNAAKFTEEGEIVLMVERRDIDGRDHITFEVRDSGIGMTAEQVAHLFERFAQADATTTRRFGGTGLGLALTRALSTMLGGSIRVESIPGSGSTFTVDLPARVDMAVEAAAIPAEASSEIRADAKAILVIDDDPAAREFLTRFLTREGYAVESASNGEDGLRMARALRPLAILLDVTMPGMDGWNVLRHVRADPEIGATPVLMQTVIDDQTFGYALGATDYLLKPVDRGRLKEAIAQLGPASASRSVLVVDDDDEARDRVSAALERDGWSVVSKPGGQAALAAMEIAAPNLILVDLLMPGMDGYAFVRAVRTNPDWLDIPIVVLTSEDLGNRKLRALAGSTSRIVQKGSMPLGDLAADLRRFADSAPITSPTAS